jgi:hypothetical protein
VAAAGCVVVHCRLGTSCWLRMFGALGEEKFVDTIWRYKGIKRAACLGII